MSQKTGGSPVLAALQASPPSTDRPPETFSTAEWAKKVPLGKSPPDRVHDGFEVASSPPNALVPAGGPRGGFSHASPPTSPSAAYRQLVRPNNSYQSFGDYLGSSPGRARPISVHPQTEPYPPPPHHPQAHYYGAPEVDFGMARPRASQSRTSEASCCIFDSLATAGDAGQRSTEDVLIVGFEHSLDVYSIGRSKPVHVGRLHGLRGTVLGAKLLPAQTRNDPLHSLRPLLAVVVHGVHQTSSQDTESRPGTNQSQDDMFDPSDSMLHALHTTDPGIHSGPAYYQTTVDLYSLKESRYLGTLIKGPKVQAEVPLDHRQNILVPPAAALSVHASSKFIVVGSGDSGEVFVFDGQIRSSDDKPLAFKCLGKFWTRTSQKRLRSLSTSSGASRTRNSSEPPKEDHRRNAPLLSLNHRWLAVVPPTSSTQNTMHAVIDGEPFPHKIPGLTTHTAPTEPTVNCETDTPEAESLLKRFGRDATQEFIKGARWVGGQGMQAWNHYWKPSDETNDAFATTHAMRPMSMPRSHPSFPPTHANDTSTTRKSSHSFSVSMLDLEKLADGQRLKSDKAMEPIATFSVPHGCSFVSFAPGGLHLLTASTKGDVQQVWSLLRMLHGEAGHGPPRNPDDRGPFVREVKRFTRVTEANIVDVVWAHPRGDKLAIVTDRRTVHIYDIPSASFQWPPPRRVLRPASVIATAEPSASVDVPTAAGPPEPMGSRFGAALNMVTGRTQPLLAAVRGRPVSAGSALSSWKGITIPGAGATSGKVVSAGINKSVGAATNTVDSLRHLGENRISLPASPAAASPGCTRWLDGRNQGYVAAVGGKVITVHRLTAGKNRPSVVASKPLSFSLPSTFETPKRPHVNSVTAIEVESYGLSASPRGFWPVVTPIHRPRSSTKAPHPLSFAEIETNAPYQPFHTDRRVGFHIYNDDDVTPKKSSGGPSAWVFGEAIPATRIATNSTLGDDEAEPGQDQTGPLENLISLQGGAEEGQQFVMTTRRKRAKERAVEDVDIFEDDCEVIDFAEDRV